MTCNHEELRHYSDGDSIAVCGNLTPCPIHEPSEYAHQALVKAIVRNNARNARRRANDQARRTDGRM